MKVTRLKAADVAPDSQPDFAALHRQYDALEGTDNDILTDIPTPDNNVFSAATRAYFDRNVTKVPGGCHVWTGKTDKNGWAWLRTEKGWMTARQFAWELAKGTLPADCVLTVKGTAGCADKKCVNADHMQAKRRAVAAKKNRHKAGHRSAKPKRQQGK